MIVENLGSARQDCALKGKSESPHAISAVTPLKPARLRRSTCYKSLSLAGELTYIVAFGAD
jgi:hypothetical protein